MRSTPSLRSYLNVAIEMDSIFVCMTTAFSRPFKEDLLALPFSRLSPPGDRWCDVLGFVPAGSVSSFSTIQSISICEGCFARQSIPRLFSLTPACPGQYTQLDNEWKRSTMQSRWIALRGDSRTTHAIILTDSMSLLQKVKSGKCH